MVGYSATRCSEMMRLELPSLRQRGGGLATSTSGRGLDLDVHHGPASVAEPERSASHLRGPLPVRSAGRERHHDVPGGVRDNNGTVPAAALDSVAADIVLGQDSMDAIHVVIAHAASPAGPAARRGGLISARGSDAKSASTLATSIKMRGPFFAGDYLAPAQKVIDMRPAAAVAGADVFYRCIDGGC
jgi:hypothetical protein